MIACRCQATYLDILHAVHPFFVCFFERLNSGQQTDFDLNAGNVPFFFAFLTVKICSEVTLPRLNGM